jgi:hypothetical protein
LQTDAKILKTRRLTMEVSDSNVALDEMITI